DTRTGLGAPKAVVGPGRSVTLQVTGRGGVPAAGVSAVVLNVTITAAIKPGYVQVYPTDLGVVGASSNLNVERVGQTIPNLVTVPLGNGGRVTLYTQGGGHLLADVFGYYAQSGPTATGRYTSLAPARVLDTRNGTGVTPPASPGDTKNCGDFATWSGANTWFWAYYPYYGDIGRLDGNNDLIPCESLSGAPISPQRPPRPKPAARSTTTLQVVGRGGVPASASAVAINVTATQATTRGYVQVLPTAGSTAIGASSNLNLDAVGQTIANLVIVPIGVDGSIRLYTSGGTHLIADVAGYYTDATTSVSTDGMFVALQPARLLDTRTGTKPASKASITLAPLNRAGVPSTGVAGIVLNLTATQSTAAGYLQVFPTGQATAGSSSNVNMERANQTIPNAALTKLGNGGTATIYVSASSHVLADISGYFTATTTSGTTVLSGLTVAPQNTTAVYNRDDWPHWSDADADCQNTRTEVLIRSSSPAATLSADTCTVTAGSWTDPYTGQPWTLPSDLQIDHVIPLHNAHMSGGWAWTTTQKTAFANDLNNPELEATAGSVNNAKSDSGPETWKPPLTSNWCQYATNWATVKKAYALTVTQDEYNALAQMLSTC
ncbi:MAG: DUF1524 domain-containing protein, partial [Phycicoccus sp.]|nr:DUF1524 domain-containing protein [Phycicoccus sp.]